MAVRTIQSPGIQIGELDRSRYDVVSETSLPNSPWCFIAGFADRGRDYEQTQIASREQLAQAYGYPQTEAERYFWNGCAEVLDSGGKLLAAKLPYDNNSRDKFAYVDYKISRSKCEIQDGAKIVAKWTTVREIRDVLASVMRHADMASIYGSAEDIDSKWPIETLPQMREAVAAAFESESIGSKLAKYRASETAKLEESFASLAQQVAACVVAPEWVDDGSQLSGSLASSNPGSRGVWARAKASWNANYANGLVQAAADAAVESQWAAACAACGVGEDPSGWLSRGEDESSLSASAASLVKLFDCVEAGTTAAFSGVALEDKTSLELLAVKLRAVAASPQFADQWTSQLAAARESQPIQTVVQLKTALEQIVAAIDSAHPFTDLAMNDSQIESYVEIIPDVDQTTGFAKSGMLTLDQLDELATGGYSLVANKLRIVDISRTQYSAVPFECVKSTYRGELPEDDYTVATNEILGIVPVVVAPTNALYYQNLIEEANPDYYSCVADFKPVRPQNPDVQVVLSQESLQENLYLPLKNGSGDNLDRQTLSKLAAACFPAVEWADASHYDQEHFKKIGVVVCQAYLDSANGRKINFQVLESFVGSLDRDAKADASGTSAFIDKVVNTSSKYIRVFSAADKKALREATIVACRDQTATSLGLYKLDCFKRITPQNSILTPIKRVLDNMKDPRSWEVDLVVDAGLTNVCQYLASDDSQRATTPDSLPKWDPSFCLVQRPSRWWAMAQIYDVFCKNTRRDCMFLLDSPRPFCLVGEEKIVRRTKPTSTVANTIVPKLKHLAGVNSSYSAGYCNWFKTSDAYSGEAFWCPPSIKAAGVYIRSDVYGKKWDAPAGMNRGRISALDVAFSPTNEEAGQIYQQCWNYAVSYPLNGIVLEGQRTFQRKATALDRVNVRRLMLHLEKEAVAVAKYYLYEGNTAYMRQRFVNALTPIFEKAVMGYGIADYRIKCDETNNTSETIDRNELHCTIAVRPVKTIEFIVLNFVVVNQTADIDEEVETASRSGGYEYRIA